MTAVLVLPVTVAVNCCEPPAGRLTVAGLTLTDTVGSLPEPVA